LDTLKTIGQVLLLFGILYLFLVSIGLMGASFKMFGKGFATQLVETTTNPYVGLFVGILATTLVQSSSTTTSLVVGIVAAAGLTIPTAIPIIMGANIGTSVTNTLVSMGHITRPVEFRRALAGATVHDFFNLIAVVILFPLELFTGYLQHLASGAAGVFTGIGGMKLANPIKASVKPAVALVTDLLGDHPWLILLLALLMMYAALKFLVDLARGLVVSKAERFLHQYLFGAAGYAMLFGAILTVLVQSSSITTSLIIPLIGAGILTIEQIFPYTLGANVGTTVTAMLAALSTASVPAITIAFVHLIFNLSGILLVYPIAAIRRIPIRLAHGLATFTSKSRSLAIAYLIVVFYLLPLCVILIWR
jgi:sodium-dependent phosphate cotransporter